MSLLNFNDIENTIGDGGCAALIVLARKRKYFARDKIFRQVISRQISNPIKRERARYKISSRNYLNLSLFRSFTPELVPEFSKRASVLSAKTVRRTS